MSIGKLKILSKEKKRSCERLSKTWGFIYDLNISEGCL